MSGMGCIVGLIILVLIVTAAWGMVVRADKWLGGE